MYIAAATSYFESQTSRDTLTRTREMWLDAFPAPPVNTPLAARIEIPHPPLQEIVNVAYVAGDGTIRSFTDGASPPTPAVVMTAPQGEYAVRGFIEPLGAWPSAAAVTGAVRIRYRSGYGDTPADMPPLIQEILCQLVAHFDTFRSAVHEARKGQVLELPYGVRDLMLNLKYTAKSSQRLAYIETVIDK